jgi:beta-lactamase class A
LGDDVTKIYSENKTLGNEGSNSNKDSSNEYVVMPEPIAVSSMTEEKVNDTSNKNVSKTNHNGTYRNVVLVDKEFDSETDYSLLEKTGLRKLLTSKKFLLVVFVLIFIFVCIVVFKTFYYGKKVDHYEEFFTTIEEKEEDYAVVYDDKDMDLETLKKVAASELVNCINSKIDENNLPDGIKNVMNEINNYYNQSYDYFAFLYRDIYTGFTVSYNQNQQIFTASTIKGPTDIYVYEMASEGKVNLDDKLTYTGGYYNTGSGVLKNKPINTSYTVRTLLEYSTVHSDNAAHNMLMDRYGRNNMLNFWKEKGTKAIFTANNNWGVTNAHDASIYMQELYRFYVNNSEYGEPLMKNFMNANPKFITGKNKYVVANKSGWSGSAIHDVSIIFADNPYIVVALSNLGATDYYMSYFNKANDLAYKLHTEYWKYKMSECNNIKQY